MKPIDHPVPSGDRTMGRALVRALEAAGHEVNAVSRLRLFLDRPDADRQNALMTAADAEIARIAQGWRTSEHPSLWFTYHNHYKAPDLLGPSLSRRFGLPYVVAEASHAPKRAEAWTTWHEAAETASRQADLHVCFTPRDRAGLADIAKPAGSLLLLPPFINEDATPFSSPVRRSGTVRLITVAMMRPGDKLASYRFLAQALGHLTNLDWCLDIVGDGPASADVTAAFDAIPTERLAWRGLLSGEAVRQQMEQADLFVWPGFGEAFGLAYLEAQWKGLPVVALDIAGVASVVKHGETGLLVRDPSPACYAAALATLIEDTGKRLAFGSAAARFVQTERTITRAVALLEPVLQQIVTGHDHTDR